MNDRTIKAVNVKVHWVARSDDYDRPHWLVTLTRSENPLTSLNVGAFTFAADANKYAAKLAWRNGWSLRLVEEEDV